MKASVDNITATHFGYSRFEERIAIALFYLEFIRSIRNQVIRAVASIDYDQTIYLFNRAISKKRLVREAHGTHYVLTNGRVKR